MALDFLSGSHSVAATGTARQRFVIRTLLYLQPKDGDAQRVVDFYRSRDVLGHAARQAGCLGSELQVPLEPGGALLVTALWRSRAAYDGWVANPQRGAWAEELGGLVEDALESGTRGAVFSVALAAVAEDPA